MVKRFILICFVFLFLLAMPCYAEVDIDGGVEYLNGKVGYTVQSHNTEKTTLPFDTVLGVINCTFDITNDFYFNVSAKTNLGIYNGDYISKRVTQYTKDGPVVLYNEKNDYQLNNTNFYKGSLAKKLGKYTIEVGYISQSIEISEREKFNIIYNSKINGPFIGIQFIKEKDDEYNYFDNEYFFRAGYLPQIIVNDSNHLLDKSHTVNGSAECSGMYIDFAMYNPFKGKLNFNDKFKFFMELKGIAFNGTGKRINYIDFNGNEIDINQDYFSGQYSIVAGFNYSI